MPVDGLEIGIRTRHLNEIVNRAIERPLAADAEVGGRRGDQRLGVRQDKPLGNRRRGCGHPVGQALALVGVKHREPFEERDRPRLIAIALGSNVARPSYTRTISPVPAGASASG